MSFFLVETTSSDKKKTLKTVEMQYVNTQISPELTYKKAEQIKKFRNKSTEKKKKKITKEKIQL